MTRYFVFHNSGQVEAVQSSSNEPAPTSWETDRGFTRLEVSRAEMVIINRDKKLTFKQDGSIDTVKVSVNPVQPTISAEDERLSQLVAKEATVGLDSDERWEYIKLRDGI